MIRKSLGWLMILTALWYLSSVVLNSGDDWANSDLDWDNSDLDWANSDLDLNWGDDLEDGSNSNVLGLISGKCRVLNSEIRHYYTQEEYDFHEKCTQEIRNGYGGLWICPMVWSTRTSREGYQSWVHLGVVDYLWLNQSIPVSEWLGSKEKAENVLNDLGLSIGSEIDCQYHLLSDTEKGMVEILLPGIIVSRC